MPEINIQNIGQIAIAVSNIEVSTEFYRDILNLEYLFFAPPGLAFFRCGEVRLMLTQLQGDEKDHHTSTIYYRVDDIAGATEALIANGVHFLQKPQLVAEMPDHELWMGFIRDPDENLIGIMAEIPLNQ